MSYIHTTIHETLNTKPLFSVGVVIIIVFLLVLVLVLRLGKFSSNKQNNVNNIIQ